MNVGLFGGAFDPIHRGHISIAQAAAKKFGLKQVHFATTGVPPHRAAAASFAARYAMVTLATQQDRRFIPSLIDSPEESAGKPSYSLYMLRRFKARMKKSDRLFFILGLDQFESIATWHKPLEVLRECEFIIAARPGHAMSEVARALPKEMRPSEAVLRAARQQPLSGELMLPGVQLHLLEDTDFDVSSTKVRSRISGGRSAKRWLTPEVAEFIGRTGIYSGDAAPATAARGNVLQSKTLRRRRP